MKVKYPHTPPYDDSSMMTGFGLAKIKAEGAPQHPDDYDWEHPPGSGCEKCQRKYERALQNYNDYYANLYLTHDNNRSK